MIDQAAKRARFAGLLSLFNNWTVSVGAVALLLFLGQYIPKLLFPGLVLIFQFLLMRRSHAHRDSGLVCDLLPHVMSRVLFFSAIIMVAINFYYLKIIDPEQFADGRANKYIPYITVLVIAPVSVVIFIWAVVQRRGMAFCRSCQLFHGHASEHGVIGRILSRESRYQLRIMLVVSIVTTIYAYTYYAIRYSNANLNGADRFYYNWIPFVLYLLSVFYMTMRYWSIFAFCEKNMLTEDLPSESTTLLRFIVLCDEKIMLSSSDIDGVSLLDTPFSKKIHATLLLDESVARSQFEALSGCKIDGLPLRILYETPRYPGHGNVYHILIGLPSRSIFEGTKFACNTWLTAYQISNAYKAGEVRAILAAEIHRIYTVAMAYKAYDRKGMRRYAIRHYRPLFNLKELIALDVDFNDTAWLLVSRDNEDRPFFQLRRFWRKYVGGFEM